ncbi:MAG: thioesterase family protein [Alphaproteobacteria bacterium]
MMKNEKDLQRGDFPWHLSIATRWADNDQYGHINNVTYYSYFDTAVNRHLIEVADQDPQGDGPIGVVVETGCQFFRPISFPTVVEVGIRIVRLGTSSVTYQIGVFAEGQEALAAVGRFIHVYVDRKAFQTVPIPPTIRSALEDLYVGE